MVGRIAQLYVSSRTLIQDRASSPYLHGLRSMGWTSSAQVICLAIRFCSNILLTRMLAPREYGIFGTAMAVITTLDLLSDLGVWPTLVRHPRGAEPRYLLTGWWVALARGSFLTSIIALLSWPMAWFYRQPELFPVLLALSLRSALAALRSPGMVLLRRRMNYRGLFVEEVAQTFIGTVVSLAAAYYLHSAWAIVLGTLAGTLTTLTVSYLLQPIRVRFSWDREVIGDLAHLGRQIFVNTLVMALWINMDRLMGARFLTLEQIGYYSVALNLALILEGFVMRGCEVYFTMLSRHHEPEAKAEMHGRMLGWFVTWGMPALALGIVLAPSVIRFLYDTRYAPSAVIFALMVARLMAMSLGQLQFQYLLSLGQIRRNTLAFGLATLTQGVLLIPLAWFWGVIGLAVAVLASTIAYAASQAVLLRMAGLGRLRPLLVTLAWMVVGLLAMTFAPNGPGWSPSRSRPVASSPSNVALQPAAKTP